MPTIRNIAGFSGVGTIGATLTRPQGAPVASATPPANLPDLRSGYVRIATTDAPWAVLDVLTTAEPSLPLPDGSGWDRITRPGRVDANVWRSGKPLQFDIPFSMDVLGTKGADVEDEWATLMRIYLPGKQGRLIKVTGPVTRPDLTWVIVNVAEDRDATKRRGRKLVRIEGTITVEQRIRADVATDDDKDSPKGKALVSRPRFATSKSGDTLRRVAKRELGDGRKWKDIAAMYPGSGAPSWAKGPDRVIPTNTKVQLPDD
jgi:hypothetical protein